MSNLEPMLFQVRITCDYFKKDFSDYFKKDFSEISHVIHKHLIILANSKSTSDIHRLTL